MFHFHSEINIHLVLHVIFTFQKYKIVSDNVQEIRISYFGQLCSLTKQQEEKSKNLKDGMTSLTEDVAAGGGLVAV